MALMGTPLTVTVPIVWEWAALRSSIGMLE